MKAAAGWFAIAVAAMLVLPRSAQAQGPCWSCKVEFQGGQVVFFGCTTGSGSAAACTSGCEGETCTCSPTGGCNDSWAKPVTPDGSVFVLGPVSETLLGHSGVRGASEPEEAMVRDCRGRVISRHYAEHVFPLTRKGSEVLEL